jgi:hypothetical protein
VWDQFFLKSVFKVRQGKGEEISLPLVWTAIKIVIRMSNIGDAMQA